MKRNALKDEKLVLLDVKRSIAKMSETSFEVPELFNLWDSRDGLKESNIVMNRKFLFTSNLQQHLFDAATQYLLFISYIIYIIASDLFKYFSMIR